MTGSHACSDIAHPSAASGSHWRRTTADTLTGIAHLLRREAPLRAGIAMVAATGSYAVFGAAEMACER